MELSENPPEQPKTQEKKKLGDFGTSNSRSFLLAGV